MAHGKMQGRYLVEHQVQHSRREGACLAIPNKPISKRRRHYLAPPPLHRRLAAVFSAAPPQVRMRANGVFQFDFHHGEQKAG
jgi:hypothetical protein